jgi:peptidoglycan/xylan/chitin deacetylase (PgdA/CDA1 family)
MRRVKLAISLLVHLADRTRARLRLMTGTKRESSFVVLYYHSVPPEHRAQFASQMDTLLRCATPVGAGDSPSLNEGGRYVAITFDDAFESLLENALPELKTRGIPCTIFAVSESLGKPANWEDIGETHGNERVMSEAQARNLPPQLVGFGSHTMSHPVLTTVSEDTARKEVFESRSKLQHILGREIRLFSFPYGAFNEHLVELCREAGYWRVFTTIPAPVRNDALAAGRTPVEPTDSKLEFRLKLAGAYRWVGFASVVKTRIKRFVGASGPGNGKVTLSARA